MLENNKSAARKYGAPGRCSPTRGAMARVKTWVNMTGPAIPVIARSELIAPCSLPCDVGSTWRDISDCMAGPATPHIAIKGRTPRRIHPLGASAKPANAAQPKHNPEIRLRRSPKRFTNGPTNAPETIAEQTPTSVSDSPTSRRLQAYRYSVYSAHIEGSEICARYNSVITTESPASSACERSSFSEPSGLAICHADFERRSFGSDSGRMK